MEPMYYIGLDVHKRKISYCVKDSGGKVYSEGSLSATRVYKIEDAREFQRTAGIDAESSAPEVQDKFISAFVRAKKPSKAAACCGPSCCK